MFNHLGALLLVEAALFVITMLLVQGKRTQQIGEYAGILFHLLLLAPILGLPCASVGQAAGCIWVGCDVVASVGVLWNRENPLCMEPPTFIPIRMAGHLFAAIWIVTLSLTLSTPTLLVGVLVAVGFAGYTLAARRLPEKSQSFSALLLLIWLVLLSRHTS